MATQEPNRDLRRMEDLIRRNADSADDLRFQDDPTRSIERALPDFVETQVEINREVATSLAAINEQLGTLVSDMDEVKSRQDSMAEDIEVIKSRQDSMAEDVEVIKNRQDSMAEDVEVIKNRQDSMAEDIGQVKGGHARAEVAREAGVIAFDMGLGYVRSVEKLELAAWAQKHSNSRFTTAELRSFRAADLVVQAIDGSEIVYIAVEISFTADKRDSDRAIRNSAMLEQFTGCQARAVVASVKNDDYVSEQVNKELIHWHPIDQRSLDPD